jgi:PAS domain S-box-containing protein
MKKDVQGFVMSFSKRFTIKSKLISLMLILAFCILLANSIILYVREVTQLKNNLYNQTAIQARLLGEYCISPLIFEDKAGAEDIISKIDKLDSVNAAILFDKNGKVFASYKKEHYNFAIPSDSKHLGVEFIDGALHYEEKIVYEGETVGSIHLHTSINSFNNQILKSLIVNLLILASQFQKSISSPIIELAKHTKEISESGKYSIREIKSSYLEIEKLSTDFNSMLDTITRKENEQIRTNKYLLESQQQFKSLIDNSPIAMVVISPDMEITYMNAEFTRLFGWVKEEINSIEEWFKNSFPDQKYREIVMSQFFDNVSGLSQNGSTPATSEIHITTKSGILRIVEIRGCLVYQGFLYIFSDLTERMKAAEAVEELNRELELKVQKRTDELNIAIQELEAFAYSVSHDLRAPLRGIHGFVSALCEDKADQLDTEGLHFLERIKDSTMRMAQLIDDLLSLSKISRQTLIKQNIDLNIIVENIVEQLKSENPSRKVLVELEKGMKVFGDEKLIEIMMTNLISNAWKYTEKVEIPRISVGRTEKNNLECFYIKDNGAGFNMKYYDKLFTPFQRLHNPNEFQGSGIGLATVYRVVKKHTGEIWAESKPDEGATFYVHLPKEE